MVRSVSEWKNIFARRPSPEGTPVEEVVAERVLGDLVGYRNGNKDWHRDVRELGNAMEAWAELTATDGRSVPEPEVPAFFRDGRDMAGNDI